VHNLIAIDNSNGLLRDSATHAVINSNSNGFNAYKIQKKNIESLKSDKQMMEDKVNSLSSDVESLKSLVAKLLEERNGTTS